MTHSVSARTLVVDIDDTISTHYNRDYENAVPHSEIIKKLNGLQDAGWKIIYFTARGQASCNGDLEKIERERGPILYTWMKKHGVQYDEIMFGKPLAAYYIDDKSLRPQEFLDFEFKTLHGGSGAHVERIGERIMKHGKNLRAQVDWYNTAKTLPYLNVPKIISYYDNTIDMEFIDGRSMNEVAHKDDMSKLVLMIFANSKQPGTDAEWSTMVDRVKDHIIASEIPEKNKIINLIDASNTHKFMNENKSFMHGDLTLGNLIKRNHEIYCIDPNYIPDVYSSYILDIGKLYQSLNSMYEEIFMDGDASPEVKKHLLDAMNNFLTPELQYYGKIAELIHYVRMVKYKSDEDKLKVYTIINSLLKSL